MRTNGDSIVRRGRGALWADYQGCSHPSQVQKRPWRDSSRSAITRRMPRALSSTDREAAEPPMSVRTQPGWMTTARQPAARPVLLDGTEAIVECRLRVAVFSEAPPRTAARAHLAGDQRDLLLCASQHRVHQRLGDLDRRFGVDAIDSGGSHPRAVDTRVVDQHVDRLARERGTKHSLLRAVGDFEFMDVHIRRGSRGARRGVPGCAWWRVPASRRPRTAWRARGQCRGLRR